MNILVSVKNVYILANEDTNISSASLSNIYIEVADAMTDIDELGQAVSVEKCECPEHYLGESCQV